MALSSPALAQGTSVSFGALRADPTLPVEMSSDTLDVSQEDGTALFKGNVTIIQGDMRLSAQSVRVVNREGGTGIERLEAHGEVLLVSGQDAAEAENAVYTIATGQVEMSGNVLLTQGTTVLGANSMVVNLVTGNATLAGRVRTTLGGGE